MESNSTGSRNPLVPIAKTFAVAVLVALLIVIFAPALTVAGVGSHGRLHGHWDTRRRGARTTLRGSFGGHPLTATFRAP